MLADGGGAILCDVMSWWYTLLYSLILSSMYVCALYDTGESRECIMDS